MNSNSNNSKDVNNKSRYYKYENSMMYFMPILFDIIDFLMHRYKALYAQAKLE